MQSSSRCRANSMEEDQDQDATGGKKVISRTFLSLSQITALSEQNEEEVQKILEEFLNFKHLNTSLKEAILLDYYTAGFWWAKEMNFSLIQLSGFMDLLNFLLENLSDKRMSLGDNLKELGRAMAGTGETDTESSGDLNFFSIEQAKAVIDYLNISLFKHYKLYEYLFHSPREELVTSNESAIELAEPADPLFSALLKEGVPSDIYSSFITSPTAAETGSKGSDQEESDQGEEPCPVAKSFEVGAVAGVTAEDQKSAEYDNPNEILATLRISRGTSTEEPSTPEQEELPRPGAAAPSSGRPGPPLAFAREAAARPTRAGTHRGRSQEGRPRSERADINEKLQMQEAAYTLSTEKLKSPE